MKENYFAFDVLHHNALILKCAKENILHFRVGLFQMDCLLKILGMVIPILISRKKLILLVRKGYVINYKFTKEYSL